jgi:flagellar motor switch protein FliM
VSEVLSNEQVEALVAAAREGQTPDRKVGERARRPKRVREVDFSRPTKFPQDLQRRFQRSHEAFCRSASTRLSAEMRSALELEVIDIDQLTWSAALAHVPQPSIYALMEVEPLGTSILLSVELPLVSRMVDRLLGGTGTVKHQVGELTEIETAIARRIFGALAEQLSMTWDDLLGLRISVRDLESKPASVQLAQPSEPTLALTMEARADGSSATMTLAVPYRAIESALQMMQEDKFAQGAFDQSVTDAVRTAVSAVGVELRAEVASVELSLDDLLALKEGDLLKLGVSSSTGITICADHVPVYRARPGRSGMRRAVEILEQLEPVR